MLQPRQILLWTPSDEDDHDPDLRKIEHHINSEVPFTRSILQPHDILVMEHHISNLNFDTKHSISCRALSQYFIEQAP